MSWGLIIVSLDRGHPQVILSLGECKDQVCLISGAHREWRALRILLERDPQLGIFFPNAGMESGSEACFPASEA